MDTKRGRIPVQCSRYLQETFTTKQENAHYTVSASIIIVMSSFYLQVSEHFE